MYCNNCGTKIRDDAAFCEECGTPVKKVDSPDPTNKEKMTKKGKSKPIIITIIAALLLIVTCVVVLQTGVLNPVKHNLELGYKYLEEGKYDEAILAFNKVIEIDENNIEARFGLVDAYEGIEDYEKAEEILNQILELDNGNQKAREKISEMKKKAYAGKKLNYSVEEKDTEDINYYTGVVKCTTDSKNVWEYETEVIPKTELDCISDVYVDEELAYFIAGGKLVAFDKYTGNIEWEIKEVGASNSLVFDKNNIYLSGYYGPNLLIISKLGEIKYKDDDDSYADDHLYFQEWYGPGDATDFVFDLNNNTYKKLETSVYSIGEMDTYKDKIYYNELRFDASATPLYEANADGSNEKVISKYVMNFDIVGNTLYYTEMEGNSYDVYSKTTIKAYDLTTKKTETVKEIPCSGWVFFSSFGYGHGKTSDDDPYGIHIIMPNGASINKKGFVSASGDNYIICQEQPVEGSMTPLLRYNVVYHGKMSDIVVIPSQSQVLGYFGGKFYYTPYDNNTWDYGKVETIVPNFE